MSEPSFDTISALGPNAAMCHYRHTNGTPRAFGQDSIYLVDSAPSTWTAPPTSPAPSKWVEVTDEHRAMFTRVLQGHIALDQAHFPVALPASSSTCWPACPLWQAGYNPTMAPATGSATSSACTKARSASPQRGSLVALQPGMVLSQRAGLLPGKMPSASAVKPGGGDRAGAWRADDAGLRATDLCAVFDIRLIDRGPAGARRSSAGSTNTMRRLPPSEPAAGGRGSAWLEQATSLI